MAMEQKANEQIREYIKAMILKQYKSISKFAAISGIDKSDLSKFLRNQKDWQLTKVLKLFTLLQSELTINSLSKSFNDKDRISLNLQFDNESDNKFFTYLHSLNT
jgi:predicted transcriptional regulator|tara:strand:- start:108 stop:422 length:315 start_codon:yes stop_codon:yes gene_type:complete